MKRKKRIKRNYIEIPPPVKYFNYIGGVIMLLHSVKIPFLRKQKCPVCKTYDIRLIYKGKYYCKKCANNILDSETREKNIKYLRHNYKEVNKLYKKVLSNLNIEVMKD